MEGETNQLEAIAFWARVLAVQIENCRDPEDAIIHLKTVILNYEGIDPT
jgi:hypothetical protein